MSSADVTQFFVYIAVLLVIAKPLGVYMAEVYEGGITRRIWPLVKFERLMGRAIGIDPAREMTASEYGWHLAAFHVVGFLLVWLVQMLQGFLPLNPTERGAVSWDSALNTAVSFVTNTNWQGYAGETTMSHLTQMIAFTTQNFLSAAVGMAVAVALARGLARASTHHIGNFWSDLHRGLFYILIPGALIFAVFLIGQGIVQTWAGSVDATTLEGFVQKIPLGPVASQVAIKMLGTNGGGFFNANAAHPFENPTPLSNFFQMLSIFLIPAALVFTFGIITRSRRHARIILTTMLVLFVALTAVSWWSETSAGPGNLAAPWMEGKETRFGVFGSVLFSTITTSASCGAVNTMHSSLTPIAGAVSMINMMLGEVIFGGVGAGLYGMLLFVIMTVFMAGLMVGRTPEYLGKKIESAEIQLVILAILAPCATILLGTAASLVSSAGLSSLANQGPHGFSEILYAFTSAAANNGSAFAGLNANTPYYNVTLALAMIIGRFAIIFPVLGIAGKLAGKKQSPPSAGTFEVDNALFGILLIGVILIVGALTFLPALSVGPIVEQFLMWKGQTF